MKWATRATPLCTGESSDKSRRPATQPLVIQPFRRLSPEDRTREGKVTYDTTWTSSSYNYNLWDNHIAISKKNTSMRVITQTKLISLKRTLNLNYFSSNFTLSLSLSLSRYLVLQNMHPVKHNAGWNSISMTSLA
jgi:hypothetical protein